MKRALVLSILLLATGTVASEYFETSVSIKADGVEVFHPVFVAKAGHTADIRQSAAIEQSAAPPQEAVPFDGEPADRGRIGNRLLFTASRYGLDGDLYNLRLEYMELQDGQWTTLLQPSMRVRQHVPATLIVEGEDASFELTLALTPRYDIVGSAEQSFQPTGLLECEHLYSDHATMQESFTKSRAAPPWRSTFQLDPEVTTTAATEPAKTARIR